MSSYNTDTLTIRVPSELKEKLDHLAEATGRSKSFLAMEAIRSYVELEAWQVNEIKVGIKELDNAEVADEKEVDDFFSKWK